MRTSPWLPVGLLVIVVAGFGGAVAVAQQGPGDADAAGAPCGAVGWSTAGDTVVPAPFVPPGGGGTVVNAVTLALPCLTSTALVHFAAEVGFLAPGQVRGIAVAVRATCVSGCGAGGTIDGEPELFQLMETGASAQPPLSTHAMAAVVRLPTAGTWRFEAVAYNTGAAGTGLLRRRTLDVQVSATGSLAATPPAPAPTRDLSLPSVVPPVLPSTPTSVPPAVRPDLALSLRPLGPLQPGGRAVYRIDVVNRGGGLAAPPITVIDLLPPALSFVEATGAGWSCGAAGQRVACTFGLPLGPRQRATLLLTVLVGATAGGTVEHTACAAVAGEVNLADYCGTAIDPVSAGRPSPSLRHS